jgi:restriction endonuclease S subunit
MDENMNVENTEAVITDAMIENQIEEMFTGSTRKNINAEQYAELKIPLVPRELQQHIVNIIQSLKEEYL